MTKVISILQNKGGVGKTTITSNLACVLANDSTKKVLIVDLDAQGNQAISFGYSPRSFTNTIYDVLIGEVSAKDAIIHITENLHLLPSNNDMNYFEIDTRNNEEELGEYFYALRKGLKSVENEYDVIFIDSPPELKIMYALLMMVTDEIYIPFEPDSYNAQGLVELIKKIAIYKEEYNVKSEIKGIIPIKVRDNTVLHRTVLDEITSFCAEKNIPVMETRITNSVKYAQCIATYRKPIAWAQPETKHAQFYFNLANEVFKNVERFGKNKTKASPNSQSLVGSI
jgi:chromosome partitioning protein